MPKPIIELTDAAVDRVKTLMAKGAGDQDILGLRVMITSTGCSGHAYKIEYATAEKAGEEVIDQNGAKVFIDPMAIMYILGSTMDYEEDDLQSQFTFTNPNEASRCGCGESFQLKSEV
jgi:iron-sulfur cluster assembly protein